MQKKFIYLALVLLILGGAIFYQLQSEPKVSSEEGNLSGPTIAPMPVPGQEGVEEMVVEWKRYSMAEVAKHNTRTDCWAVVNNSVYGLTEWIAKHPGGADKIIALCGRDGSSAFNAQHGEFAKAKETLAGFKIGELIQ